MENFVLGVVAFIESKNLSQRVSVSYLNIIHWKCATPLSQISGKFVCISCKNDGDGHDDDKVSK